MHKLYSLVKRYRIALTRVLMGAAGLLVIFSRPAWRPEPIVDEILDLLAFVLVLAATFGRLWALSYIGDRKTKDLVTLGPYSITRNPLYLFSFLGALGIAIVTDRILFMSLVVIGFALYYPIVIMAEETRLERVHGQAFVEYKRCVPRFFPRLSRYVEPAEYPVSSRSLRRSFFSVMWFPLLFVLFLFVEDLREAGVIPVLFTLP